MSRRSTIQKLLTAALSLLVPQQCIGCKTFSETPLCKACLSSVPSRLSIGSDASFDNITTLFSYEGLLKTCLAAIKFDQDIGLADQLGQWLPSLSIPKPSATLVVPVPLHPKRQKTRTFNQVTQLFKPLVTAWGLTWVEGVHRRVSTPPLYDLDPDSRKQVLAGAFEAKNPSVFVNQTVLIVDDIYTTGATLNEISGYLKPLGAARISGLCLCRALS